MRLALRELRIFFAIRRPEQAYSQISEPLRRRDRLLEDPKHLFFHLHAMFRRPDAQVVQGLVIDSSDAQTRHRLPSLIPRDRRSPMIATAFIA